MAVVIDGTTGISTPAEAVAGNLSYTGTLTGGAGVINLGSGQLYKDASGNVGIGTSSPTNFTPFGFGPTVESRGGHGGSFIVSNDVNTVRTTLSNTSGATGGVLKTLTSHPLIFGTADTERARIDSSGNFFVNTTTLYPGDGNTSTGCMIQAGSTGGKVFASASAGNEAGSFNRNDNGTLIKILRSGSIVGSIGVSTTNTSFNTSSDYRLKEAIAPMTGALARVAALRPCTYKWKVDGSDGQGFIAHELAEVEPGCVTGEKDAVDAEGKPQYQGIDTSFLVATLAAAIQEQQAMLAAQAISINALNERLTALEGTAA